MSDGVIGAAPTSDCVNWSFLLSEVTRAVGAAPTWKWCLNSSLFLRLLFDSVLMLLPVPLQFAGAVKTKYLSVLKREVCFPGLNFASGIDLRHAIVLELPSERSQH